MEKLIPAPQMCLCLTARTIREDLALLERYRSLIDLVELRADFLELDELLRIGSFPELAKIPVILSIRRVADGGHFELGEAKRLVLLAGAISDANMEKHANFSFVDLECDFRAVALEEACKTFGIRIIRSVHEIAGVPNDLDGLLESLALNENEIPKIAVTPHNAHDLARFFVWAARLNIKEKIMIAMGPHGLPTRILSAKTGSFLTYTSASDPALPVAAPGQLDPEELSDTYRFRGLNRSTQVFFASGGQHAFERLAPVAVNKAFFASKANSLLLPLPATSAEELLQALEVLGACGASLYPPLSSGILNVLAHADHASSQCNYCDTIKMKEGVWQGFFLGAAALTNAIISDKVPSRAIIIGAGPTARNTAFVIAKLGVDALVISHNPLQGSALAKAFGYQWLTPTEFVHGSQDNYREAVFVTLDGENHLDLEVTEWMEFTGTKKVYEVGERRMPHELASRALRAGATLLTREVLEERKAALQVALWKDACLHTQGGAPKNV